MQDRAVAAAVDSGSADAVGTIELELLRLVRHLETFGRRGSLYARVDRAGYLAMRVLDDLGQASTNALAHALHLDSSTVTRQVAALARAGYVKRHADPADRRSSILALTAAGRRCMREVGRERRKRIQALVRGWSEAEQEALGQALTRLNASLARSHRAAGQAAAAGPRTFEPH